MKPSPVHPLAKVCPVCGSKKIRVVTSDYPTTVRGRRVIVPNLPRQECPHCGEVFFDRNAMRAIEQFWPRRTKAHQTA